MWGARMDMTTVCCAFMRCFGLDMHAMKGLLFTTRRPKRFVFPTTPQPPRQYAYIISNTKAMSGTLRHR